MLALVGMLIPLFVPYILAAMLITTKSKTRLEWLFAVWFTFAFSLFYFLTGGWFLLSYAFRYVAAGLVLVAMMISFLRMPKTTSFANLSQPGYKFKLATYLVPSMIFTILSVVALWGRFYSGQAVTLAFPLKDGTYSIAQGGGTTLVNAHHPYGGQSYSLDIVRLNSFGARAEGVTQTSLEQFAIFGAPIYSPCDGNISTAVNGLEDIAPGAPGDTQHAAGNHVFINCQNGEIQVLLAHMKKNSLVVTQGTSVKVGDPIGQVGNSGNTTEPHLHIHASKGGTPDRLISGVGLPILFNEKFLVRNDIVAD